MNVAKTLTVFERFHGTLTFDFFNLFNHANLFTPSVSLNSTNTFGQITSDTAGQWSNIGVGARRVQASLRIDF